MFADHDIHRESNLFQPAAFTPNNTGSTQFTLPQSSLTPPVKYLNYADLVAVCQALGGTPGRVPIQASINEKRLSAATQPDDQEKQLNFCSTVPAPYGLYKRVIDRRKVAWWKFQILAFVYNACLVLQLVLGAALTALGAEKKRIDALAVIGALNTVNAGLIALLHNSGIPTRYRNDWDEWSKVEVYMMDIMQSGVVQSNMTKEDVVATCQAMYFAAFATVANNKPSSYIPTLASAFTGRPKVGTSGNPDAANNQVDTADPKLAV